MLDLYLIHKKQLPILEQLFLEEALLRADTRNFCLINEGTAPAIVMGISGKKELLVEEDSTLPLIRRFSGGGTVVVDEKTLFITFIFNHKEAQVLLQPEAIMKWSEPIYLPVFDHPLFRLRENDYVIGEKKCGGNAQYLCKDRFLHHTSFLWDFDREKMAHLKHPLKTPSYRANRNHEDFLCTLNQFFEDQDLWIERFKNNLSKQFKIHSFQTHEEKEVMARPHRRATSRLN